MAREVVIETLHVRVGWESQFAAVQKRGRVLVYTPMADCMALVDGDYAYFRLLRHFMNPGHVDNCRIDQSDFSSSFYRQRPIESLIHYGSWLLYRCQIPFRARVPIARRFYPAVSHERSSVASTLLLPLPGDQYYLGNLPLFRSFPVPFPPAAPCQSSSSRRW